MISLEEFKNRITIITGYEANIIRERYVSRFVDTTSDYFRKHIAVRNQFENEEYYLGYLWDSLKQPEIITEDEILRNQELLDKIIYIMWDLHSSREILIKDYWKFPKEAVLKIKYRDFLEGIGYLPEDIYIFNEEIKSSLILTHEYFDDGKRYCLRARAI